MVNFGFFDIGGDTIQLKITQRRGINFMGKLAIPALRNMAVTLMNQEGKRAEKMAKRPSFSPYDKGALTESIKWRNAKRLKWSKITLGRLEVGVPYGRRQHFEHGIKNNAGGGKPKPYYLWRALRPAAKRTRNRLVQSRVFIEMVLMGQAGDARGAFTGGEGFFRG